MDVNNSEKVLEWNSEFTCVTEGSDGAIYLATASGDVLRLKDGQLKQEFHHDGRPSGIAIDEIKRVVYIADMMNQIVYSKSIEEGTPPGEPNRVVDQHEGVSLLGPNSLVFAENSNRIFFTDSGPFGETSLENPKGSVFMIELEDQMLKSLALSCLAYPTGLALDAEEKVLYVSETCKNRIIRFVQNQEGIFYSSVFYQFSGRFGPMSLAIAPNGNLLVSRYEFITLSNEGLVSVISANGDFISDIHLPMAPEISCISFARSEVSKGKMIYITENSNVPTCTRMLVHLKDDDKSMENTKDSRMGKMK